jgi:flagellin-like protein
MKNTKGISDIIATLILILLTIVLVGVVWVVVSGIVTNSTKQTTTGAQCFDSGVQVTTATCRQSGADCNVTVQRTTGSDTIGGIRLVFLNAAGNSSFNDTSGNIQTLASVTAQDWSPGVSNVTEVDAAIYFTDAAGNKNICSGATKFTTVQLVP